MGLSSSWLAKPSSIHTVWLRSASRQAVGLPSLWRSPMRSNCSTHRATCGSGRRLRSILHVSRQWSVRRYPHSSSLGPSTIGRRRQTAPKKSPAGATTGRQSSSLSIPARTTDSFTRTSGPERYCLVTGWNTTARRRTMQVTACTSFSIATSTEGRYFAVRALTPPPPRNCGRGRRTAAPSIRPDHLEHRLRTNLEIIAFAAGADDRAGKPGLVDAVPDHGLVDMDGDDLTQGQPGRRLLAIGALQLNDLRQLALERHRAFRHPRHVDELAGHRGQPGDLELADVMGDVGGGCVHLFRQVHGGEIPDELAALLDIGDGILPGGRGKTDDGRVIAEAVEEAVGRQIDIALGVARRDPADRARGDDGVEGIVLEAVAVLRFVKMQVFRAFPSSFGLFPFSSLRGA